MPVNVPADVNWAKLVTGPGDQPRIPKPSVLDLKVRRTGRASPRPDGPAGGEQRPHAATHSGAGSFLRYPPTPGRASSWLQAQRPHLRRHLCTCRAAADVGSGGPHSSPARREARRLPAQAVPPGRGDPSPRRRSQLLRPGPTRSLRVASGPGFTRRHEAGRSSNRRPPAARPEPPPPATYLARRPSRPPTQNSGPARLTK